MLFKIKGRLNAVLNNLKNKISSSLYFLSENRHCIILGTILFGSWGYPIGVIANNSLVGWVAFVVLSILGTILMYTECGDNCKE